MMGGYSVVALIPARGGSKSVKRKNVRLLCGKPLIVWTIETAKSVQEIDHIFVTTDDDEIAAVSKRNGAQVIRRPAALATDDAMPIDVIRHALKTLPALGVDCDLILYLEPTCPLRSGDDLLKALHMLVSAEQFDAVASFSKASLHPHRAWKLEGSRPSLFLPGANPWLPRQKLPEAFQLNGAVYAFRKESITETSISPLNGKIGGFVIPEERAIDIDDEKDFRIAELLMKRE
jgi:CMP-N,N'-diacetyllegionaminic acid synthase